MVHKHTQTHKTHTHTHTHTHTCTHAHAHTTCSYSHTVMLANLLRGLLALETATVTGCSLSPLSSDWEEMGHVFNKPH